MSTIVVGLGNPIMTDDGVGPAVAGEVRRALGNQSGAITVVTEAGVGGLRLAEMLDGYDRAIIIDSMDCGHDDAAGDIVRMTREDLDRRWSTRHTASAHDATLPAALAAIERVGLSPPPEIVIYAITVTCVSEFGESMTREVTKAVRPTAAAILNELTSVREPAIHAGGSR